MGIQNHSSLVLAKTFLSYCILTSIICWSNKAPIVVHPGRHVCLKAHHVQNPVKRTETYCKPIYKKHLHMCDRDGTYRLCTSFRVVYQQAYREVYRMQKHTKMIYACCPGWTQRKPGDNSCMQRVCSAKCMNGGRCIDRGRCECPKGWTGHLCEKDVDECASKYHNCKTKCINKPGSYTCACEEGFKLSADGKKCKLCLSCLPEYTEFVGEYKGLVKKVLRLENEKIQLKHKITRMEKEYRSGLRELQNDMEAVAEARTPTAPLSVTPPPPIPTKFDPESDPPTIERIESLSQQIAILEERLEECSPRCHPEL